MPTAGSLPLSLAPLASRQAVTITNNDFGAKVIALLKIFNKNLDELSTGGLADALSERARVEQLITGDLNELRERHERRVRASAWSVAVIILAATVIWAGWYFRPFSSNSPVSDTAAFRITEESSPASKPLPFPESHGGVEPVLYLSSVLGVEARDPARDCLLLRNLVPRRAWRDVIEHSSLREVSLKRAPGLRSLYSRSKIRFVAGPLRFWWLLST